MNRDVFATEALYYVLQREFKMRIAVCDDERCYRDVITNAVYEYSNMHRLEIVIDEFICGEDLLNSASRYDIVFLDYMMDGIDGLETAKTLRKRSINCTIIFLTSFPHFVYESFEVSTFRFFEKPLNIEKLYAALDDYFRLFGNDYPLLLKENRSTICVQTNDIVFLEADNKKCYVHLTDKKLHCAKTMAAISRLVPMNIFYKVNKAFIVNFNFISGYDRENIYFKTGGHVHVSRTYLNSFKEAYRKFAKGRFI